MQPMTSLDNGLFVQRWFEPYAGGGQATKFYAGDLKAIAGVAAAIAAIEAPKCVASSGTPEKIRHGLECAGLHDLLSPHIFSATQVKRGKPAPDLFLFAASEMGAAPGRCLVIEDSVAGVTAAVAAGMTVLGFHGGSHCRKPAWARN